MRRVTGIGGIFFKSRDPKALAQWYRDHLGLDVQEWGGVAFRWSGEDNPTGTGTTIWSPFSDDTAYFAPSQAAFMVNLRVADLDGLLEIGRAHV
jgi:catechol 2,3-dioxygenase-like lactoylglutathione lyase family enzyme